MTDVPIRVKVSSEDANRGKQEVVRHLKDIRAAAANTNEKLEQVGPATRRGTKEAITGIDLLKRALLALGGIAIIRKILDLANAFADVRNRVLLVTNSVNETNQVLDRLFDIANRARAPIEQLASLFQKGSIAAKELGASQEELFKFTELVARGLAIQGGSAATASGALLQLSQALGSGIVRAEEFNSILEGAFPIAQAAAKGLDRAGGSVAKLRQLIVAGEVTSKEFFQALLSQADDLEATFARIEPTVRSAGIVFRNNFIKLMESSQGLFGAVAKAILFIGENLETISKIAAVAGAALLTAFAPAILGTAIAKITAALGTLNLVLLANPVGAVAAGFVALATAIAVFGDDIQVSSDKMATLGDVTSIVMEDLGTLLGELGNYIAEVFDPLVVAIEDVFGKIDISLESMIKFTARVIDTWIGLFSGAFSAIIAVFANLPAVLNDLFVQAFNAVMETVETAINDMISGINQLLDAVGIDSINNVDLSRLETDAVGAAGSYGESIADAFKDGFNLPGVEDYVEGVFERAEQKAKDRLGGITENPVDLEDIVTNPEGLEDKVGGAAEKAKDKAKEEFDLMKEAMDSVLGNMEDYITEFVRTGKFNFKDFVNSVLDDLARLAVQQFVTKPLNDAIGSITKSIDFGSLFSFSQGTEYVPRDMLAMVHRGERIVSANENRYGNTSNNSNINVNLVMPNVTDYKSFRQNQAQAQATVARSLQNSMKRNN